MPAKERPHFDIDILDLTEEFVDACARLHAASFPEKIETLLGLECITDCLRRRYLAGGDCFCRVAVLKSNRQLVSYCYAEPMRGTLANAFLSPPIAKEHLLRKFWFRPRVWWWLVRRIIWKFARRGWNEGERIKPQPSWEVAKMLAVHPDVRGGNVGMDMMLDNEAEARKRGVTRICGLIERGNIKAEKLYASIGWTRTTPDADPYQVFAMHKDLT